MLPTLRQLQYLKLLAEHGAFGKAADAAHVTQPTLSAGIQELEKILGAPVVDRARSGVILTAVGEAALARAHVILNEAEELAAGGAERRSAPDGPIPAWSHSDHSALSPAPGLAGSANQISQSQALSAGGSDPEADRRPAGRATGRRPHRPALRHNRTGLRPCLA